jgi:hypothetical protein
MTGDLEFQLFKQSSFPKAGVIWTSAFLSPLLLMEFTHTPHRSAAFSTIFVLLV